MPHYFLHFFLFQGPSALCANEGISDFTSHEAMREHGWDLTAINADTRLVLTERACDKRLDFLESHKWKVQQWSTASISTSFWGVGTATLEYGNCNNAGDVTILLDDSEIAKSKINEEMSNVTFNVDEGTILTIRANDRAIIRLFNLELKCGK